MNGNEQDTEPTLRTIAEMLTALRGDVGITNTRLQSLETRVGNLDTRLSNLENRVEQGFEQARLQMLSVNVQLERNEALGHEALYVAKHTRADVMVLNEEVHSWACDFQSLLKPII